MKKVLQFIGYHSIFKKKFELNGSTIGILNNITLLELEPLQSDSSFKLLWTGIEQFT